MQKDKSYKKADYDNRIPFYANKIPQYRAYNKLTGFPNRKSLMQAKKDFRRAGKKVIVKDDILYWR